MKDGPEMNEMNHDPRCRQARLLWMELFDGERSEAPLPTELARHLEHCPECGEFARGAQAVRSLVAAKPLPPANTAADRALLAALSRPEPPAESWHGRLRGLVAGLRGAGLRPVVVAGIASFLVTLAAGTALTVAPVSSPVATAPRPEPAPTRRAERDLETRLDDWISQPATRLRPRPRTVPAPPRERSDRGIRFHAA